MDFLPGFSYALILIFFPFEQILLEEFVVSFLLCMHIRYRLRFFVRVGHETPHSSSGNKRFSLNNVSVRPTKIMNRANKNILFKVGLLVQYFSKNFFSESFYQFSTLKDDFESHIFEVFHNFGKSDGDNI